jgi:hypothetical protein
VYLAPRVRIELFIKEPLDTPPAAKTFILFRRKTDSSSGRGVLAEIEYRT